MGVVIPFSSKSVRVHFRRWVDSTCCRELVVAVGQFDNVESAQAWYNRLVGILDIDGEIVVVAAKVENTPWKELRQKGKSLVRPYDAKGNTLWEFVRSLEESIQKQPLLRKLKNK